MKVYENLQLENMLGEIWKEIEGYEGRYKVSNLGRVKSLDYRHTGKEKILKQTIVNGYCKVGLYNGGKSKSCFVHRLVAEAFIGFILEGFEVDHINGNRSDNKIDNLRIVTHYENMNNEITVARTKTTMRARAINNKRYMDELDKENIKLVENSYYSNDIFYFYRNAYKYPSISFLY